MNTLQKLTHIWCNTSYSGDYGTGWETSEYNWKILSRAVRFGSIKQKIRQSGFPNIQMWS